MFLGKVIGKLIATRKDERLEGAKFLIIQPLNQEYLKEGKPIVAVDLVQAGPGDFVYLVKSREASIPWIIPNAPIDASIAGIIDKMEITPQ